MSTPPAPSEYLVLSRGQWDKDLPPERIQTAIDDFYTWLDRMVEEGRMKTGRRLHMPGKVVSRGDSRRIITDGPYGEAKEVVGGYWFVVAPTLEAAAEYMTGNPCIDCGLSFEVRPIDEEKCSATQVTNETPAR